MLEKVKEVELRVNGKTEYKGKPGAVIFAAAEESGKDKAIFIEFVAGIKLHIMILAAKVLADKA